MRTNLINRLKEEWNNLDPVDPLRGLIADAIDALVEAQPSKPWVGLVWGELPEDGHNHDFLRGAAWAEAKLREKNT